MTKCRARIIFLSAGSVALESDVVGIFFPIVPITRTNMFCFGTESTIAECFFDGANGDPDCDHADDLIVVCTGM